MTTVDRRTDRFVAPFTILVDSQEKQPYTFQGLRDSTSRRPMAVNTLGRTLGRWIDGEYFPGGDYSIDGFEDRVRIERKSQVDAYGTILGWGDRRRRFERELAILAETPHAAVIVECDFGRLIKEAPATDHKTAIENARVILGQVPAWMNDYRVPWLFIGTRREAEIVAFRLLQRAWRKSK